MNKKFGVQLSDQFENQLRIEFMNKNLRNNILSAANLSFDSVWYSLSDSVRDLVWTVDNRVDDSVDDPVWIPIRESIYE